MPKTNTNLLDFDDMDSIINYIIAFELSHNIHFPDKEMEILLETESKEELDNQLIELSHHKFMENIFSD